MHDGAKHVRPIDSKAGSRRIAAKYERTLSGPDEEGSEHLPFIAQDPSAAGLEYQPSLPDRHRLGSWVTYGIGSESRDFLGSPVSGQVHVHDVQATILHLLGLDHRRLTFRFQGRDFRLTDVAGEVIEQAVVA
jgi:hypothetical protein